MAAGGATPRSADMSGRPGLSRKMGMKRESRSQRTHMELKMAHSWVEIDLAALRHNYSRAKERLAPGSRILGVVKSDAYGHGMIPVARELVACGASFLAVSKHWEAVDLRAAGIRLPILCLLGVEPSEMAEAIRNEIRPVIYRIDHARRLSDTARSLNATATVHVKLDTGMGRLGIPCRHLEAFLNELLTLPAIRLEGVLSHFASADEADKTSSTLQLTRFREAMALLSARGLSVLGHIANSAGLLDLPQAHFDLARPGIMLYGSPPSLELHKPADLRPVMTFKSKIIQLKDVQAGQPIGYGGTFVTAAPGRIATIPVGYDDGYPRLLSNRGRVLVRGMSAPVVGRVSMNMITADVTHIPSAREDDEVVLLGAQGTERVTAEEIAQLCGTISYEIYCSIGRNRFKSFHNGIANSN